jgi:hypothetical protein
VSQMNEVLQFHGKTLIKLKSKIILFNKKLENSLKIGSYCHQWNIHLTEGKLQ